MRYFCWLTNAATQPDATGAFHTLGIPFFLLVIGFTSGLLCSISFSELVTELVSLASSKLAAQKCFVIYNDLCYKRKKVILSIFFLFIFCSSVNQSERVTVYFHAVLSKDFKLNPETHKVFIKAQGVPGYIDWNDNVCELNCTK